MDDLEPNQSAIYIKEKWTVHLAYMDCQGHSGQEFDKYFQTSLIENFHILKDRPVCSISERPLSDNQLVPVINQPSFVDSSDLTKNV